eukprot:TRINITY_DN6468_c0_g1_i1.p1 TRINITY_DN6468_c0_g1~~TRINITY_DN6468_c0_g1_i1.p1  ORF type:complete len:222 (+),score=37.70 TRINITY_DN6468_c0_g1_i1:113-778(+)
MESDEDYLEASGLNEVLQRTIQLATVRVKHSSRAKSLTEFTTALDEVIAGQDAPKGLFDVVCNGHARRCYFIFIVHRTFNQLADQEINLFDALQVLYMRVPDMPSAIIDQISQDLDSEHPDLYLLVHRLKTILLHPALIEELRASFLESHSGTSLATADLLDRLLQASKPILPDAIVDVIRSRVSWDNLLCVLDALARDDKVNDVFKFIPSYNDLVGMLHE